MPLGDTPYINRGGQVDYKRLFYSNPNHALTKTVHVPGGFGVLPAGQVMGKVSESTNRLGYYTPYVTEAVEPGTGLVWPGLAYLVTDGAASTSAYVTMDDSYKFAIGDHLVGQDSDDTPIDLGAITAIDRTTYTHMALITVTNNVTTALTIAKGACISIQTTTGSPYTKALGILATAIDTGEGENAKGGDGVMILKNAMLYKNLLQSYDANALTDLSNSVEDGQYLVM